MAPPPDDRAAIAHILRRLTFGPRPGQVEGLVRHGPDGVRADLLDAPDPDVHPPSLPKDDAEQTLLAWWLRRMASPDAGLHEKMVWFWHGHFTSSTDKAEPALLARQQTAFRRHALGDFPSLVRALATDAAMLEWLDGDGSKGDAPNENLARELMELFTLGRGAYSEADVRAGARALSGWYVDEGGVGRFDADSHYDGPLTFLGRTNVRSVDDVVDAICSHPQCAPFVATAVHRYLVGVAPDDGRLSDLAGRFARSGLSIRALVRDIVEHDSFMDTRLSRPRFPVEWVTAANAVVGADPGDDDLRYRLEGFGQVPFRPPNVAGWPPGRRWVATNAAINRMRYAMDLVRDDGNDDEDANPFRLPDDVDGALARCSLFEVTARTRDALAEAGSRLPDASERGGVLVALALSSPEFALA